MASTCRFTDSFAGVIDDVAAMPLGRPAAACRYRWPGAGSVAPSAPWPRRRVGGVWRLTEAVDPPDYAFVEFFDVMHSKIIFFT
ncbi:hypothetical protein NL676_033867 [Syzygium grande]|nr:hypothetical protein NL676_033867 [Syzygium grande]